LTALLPTGDHFRALVGGRLRGPWPTFQRAGLFLASVPYDAATRVRNWLYDRGWKQSWRAPVPVVSVGNLTLGGTGKTPCVEYVARVLCDGHRRVAILSRGYGSAGGRNDEALLLEDNLPDVPHLQGADRADLARIAVEELESEALVLDDGFQHRRLARDLDVVLVDATDPWGHGRLFPRGLLRESPRGLRRAGAVVLTRCDQVEPSRLERLRADVARLAPHAAVAESVHAPLDLVNPAGTRPADDLAGRRVAAFCGVGNPDSFRNTLAGAGAEVGEFRTYPDHHPYTREDVEALREWGRRLPPDCTIVTTQKDMVKLRLESLGGRGLWALRVRLRFLTGQDAFDHQLRTAVGDRPAPLG
jgi:tetraacyldisaccharide 4'-kinase